ncbi:MAG: tRNA (guanosine(37)-N1)-methyltransferase TrmD [Pseudomonadota bacterium]
MRFDVLTLFPEMFESLRAYGVTGRAFARGLVVLRLWNPRDFTTDPHRTVDDRPYGGGPGMVMKVEPLKAAILAARREVPEAPVWYLSPQGRTLTQAAVRHMAEGPGAILIAGRYEGVDERLIERYVDAEWSVGDYVLSGGELAAMVLMDAVIRLLPGVLGDAESAQRDSYMEGLLDHPHYTRPEEIDGMKVPGVLLGGHHEAVRRWRLARAMERTYRRRPELLMDRAFTEEENIFLQACRADEFARSDPGENG